MDKINIPKLRLYSQQVSGSGIKSAKELVNYMGAMQAQDFAMAKWAIGLRVPDLTEQKVEEAFNKGEILRTHLLRPTWHIVSSDDIYWMLDLTAYRIKNSLRTRHNELELTAKVLSKSNLIIEKSLLENGQLSREELVERLNAAKISTDKNRASHIFLNAELEGIICSGEIKKGKPAYALLGERVPVKKSFSRDESLTMLAKKYFGSRSPATIQDFTWWSGLPTSDVKTAVENIKQDLSSELINNKSYLVNNNSGKNVNEKETVFALAAFDEYIISYKDRSDLLPSDNIGKAIMKNGMFKATIVQNGQVVGIWNRTIKKENVIIKAEYFKKMNKTNLEEIEKVFTQYGKFLNKKPEVNHKL
ncbi:MAG: winged helix DNA-binding domain-containing protein [Ignavibacteriales bacterium]|nr:MAG: winged helix DNA-binding domain-containing protein [Ignavibacteriales bacterium]